MTYALLAISAVTAIASVDGRAMSDDATVTRGASDGARPQYRIVRLSTTDGSPNSRGSAINNLGIVSGSVVDAGPALDRHAAIWVLGHRLDLDPLGGPNSSVVWPGRNDIGTVVGIA